MWLQQWCLSPHGAAASLTIFLFPLLVLLITARLLRPSRQLETLSGIPSPPRLPIIGHLHLVGALPHVSLRDLAAKHASGGLMLLRLGSIPNLIVSSPRVAQAIMRTHDHIFASRSTTARTNTLMYSSSDIALAPYSEHWRQARKLVTGSRHTS